MHPQSSAPLERRSFLTRLNAGLASFAAMAGVAMAQEKASPARRWEPSRHDQDEWLEKPTRHRAVFDTNTVDGLGDQLYFTNGFINVNRTPYGVQNGELAVVMVVRHDSTPFGFNDAMWKKYGRPFSERAGFRDPKSLLAPDKNLYNVPDYDALLPNRGVTLDSLFKMGMQLAVCSIATRGYAGTVAAAVGGNANAIFEELTHNLVGPNARMVPAGIVTVNRAQERGYTLMS